MDSLALIAYIGAAQGFLLLLLIALRYRRRKNVPLAALLFVYSARLGTIPLWNAVSMGAHPWLLPLTTPLPYLFGPLLWLYTRNIVEVPRSKVSDALHFLPYAADLLFLIVLVGITPLAEYRAMISAIFAGHPPLHLTVRNAGKVVVNVLYVGRAIAASLQKNTASRTTKNQRLWLRALTFAPVASLAFFGFVALNPESSALLARNDGLPFTLLAAAMAFLLYVFSYCALVAPEIPASPDGAESRSTSPAGETTSAEDIEYLQSIMNRVDRLLAEGLFSDSDLTLPKLATTIGVHPNLLSRAVNSFGHTSFPDLIHRYRIERFIARALQGELDSCTILDLAFDVGFSSKSTFNRVFRDTIGVSPTQFRRRITGDEAFRNEISKIIR